VKKAISKVDKSQSVKSRLFRIFSFFVPIILMYLVFFVMIPSQVSYADVWTKINSLTIGQNILLILAGLSTIFVYGLTSTTVLPGLSFKRGVQSAVTGQLTSVVLPVPLDLVIRFKMYKSYGFSVKESTVAVGMAGIARYFTVFAIPLIGLTLLLLTGQGTTYFTLWFLFGGAVFIFALWFMRLILSSNKSAKRIGGLLQNISNFALKVVRRSPKNNISDIIVDFGARTHRVGLGNFVNIAVSSISWGLASYFVLFLAIRFCGIDASQMSAAYILLVTGLMLLFNAFPITPGGIGVTETILLSIISFSSPSEQAAFAAALFLYRIYTWLLPLPVGLIAYGIWRYEIKKRIFKAKRTALV
jgi:uncharacterized membrane protein YbhN (UPF0104 family)